MTFDPELVDRVRTVLGEEQGLSERKMFGGHAFLVRGNLAVSASSTGGLMVRADPARAAGLLATEGVEPFAMNGRAMRGWLAVDADVVTGAMLETCGRGGGRTLPNVSSPSSKTGAPTPVGKVRPCSA